MLEYFNITTERARHARARYALSGKQSMVAPDELRVDVTTNYRTTTRATPVRPNSINQFGPVLDALYREHNVEILPGGRYRVRVSGTPAEPDDPIDYPPTWENPGPIFFRAEGDSEWVEIPFVSYDDTTPGEIWWTWIYTEGDVTYVVYVTYYIATGEWAIMIIHEEEGVFSYFWEDTSSFANPWFTTVDGEPYVHWFYIPQSVYDETYAATVEVRIGPEVEWV